MKKANDIKLEIKVGGKNVYSGAPVMWDGDDNELTIKTSIGKTTKQDIVFKITRMNYTEEINEK